MTTLTEGQHKGEFIVQAVDADRGDISFDAITFASGSGTVADGTVVKDNGSGKAVPIAGTVDTAGDSNEDIIGIAFGKYDTTADVAGAIVARLAVVDVNKLTIPGSNDSAVIKYMKKTLQIVAR
jgi:hypothetical protein